MLDFRVSDILMNPTHNPTLKAPGSNRLLRIGPTAAIFAFVCVVLWRLILLRQSLYWGDIFLYFHPMEEFVQKSLRAGYFPLWNPYVFCGQPLVGNPQSWVFYPTTPLLLIMPVWLYFSVNSAIHLSLSGLGAYLYLRRLTGDRIAALFGAIVFAGSGFVVARLQFPPMIQSAAYLPLMLLLVDRMIERPRIWYGAMMASVVALTVLAAHAQIAYMTFACAFIYALCRILEIRRHGERVFKASVEMAGALVLGTLAASVQLLPSLQLFNQSTRGHLTWDQANRFVFVPEQILNFLFPNYYGNPIPGDFWGTGNIWEPCVYVGIIPLILAIYGIVRCRRRAAVKFYLAVGAIALWLSLGRFGGLFFITYSIVPGAASFHDPARFLFLTTFAIAALSAMGMRAVRDRGIQPNIRRGLLLVAAVNILWFSASFNPTLEPGAFDYRARVLAQTPPSGQGRVFTFLREAVWNRYLNYSDYGPESARYAHELTDTLSPNAGMRFGVEEASGYEPVPVRALIDTTDLVHKAIFRHSSSLPLLLDIFNVHSLLVPESQRFEAPGFVRLHAKGIELFKVARAGPRAWLVRKTTRVDGDDRSLAAISAPSFDPGASAIVSGEIGIPESTAKASGMRESVAINPTGPTSYSAQVDCGDHPGFLVWSEAFYPGWQAMVDRSPVRIIRTNHAFQGLSVPAGAHHVTLRYRPHVFHIGLYLSLMAWGGIAGSFVFGLIVRPAYSRFQGRRKGICPPLVE